MPLREPGMPLTRMLFSGQSGEPHVKPLAVLQAVRFQDSDPHEVDVRRRSEPASDFGEEARLIEDLRPNSQPQLGPDALLLELCGPIEFVATYTLQYCPGAKNRAASLPATGFHSKAATCPMIACSMGAICHKDGPCRIIIQTLKRSSSSCSVADTGMLPMEGCGTRLPLGFTELRVETNSLQCSVTEQQPPSHHSPQLPDSEPAAGDQCIKDPVHLLCRVLRLSLVCYWRVELAAEQTDEPLRLRSMLYLVRDCESGFHEGYATLDSIAELAVVMQCFAAAEGLDLRVAPNKQSIIVHRISS